ncbi:MAG TPA: chromosome segregation protein SMC [Stellaceae bacterium]|nr:chromosome segregation protein SMC [Stellaceae bacterium]
MQFERLRLAGFKSFVEPTELSVEPGLTGIVGPNGCGKSNLVEALRWVMGEASARRLRGGDMDDVIFGGAAGRPARNIAEVALTIDNSGRDAPFAFNDAATIEVVRRIARGAGSEYRVNGRETRARDVQLLFADAVSGPHSGALVGQGRVGALISAKPGERRLLLDEAAGTAGLHARRHEADLKLEAAEVNLSRLDDVVATLTVQIETLKKQARHAQRYRRLGEQIRRCEAQLLNVRWRQAAGEAAGFAAGLRETERGLAAATETALVRERGRAAAEALLPGLRTAQATAAAARQRIAHARESLEQELSRAASARGEAERRAAQIAADFEREAEHLDDAAAALVRLVDERAELEAAGAASERQRAEAVRQLNDAAAAHAAAETGLQQMTEACAAGEARRAMLDRQVRDLAERRRRVAARLTDGERQRVPALAAIVPPEAIAAAAAGTADAAGAIEAAQAAAATAGDTLAACQTCEAMTIDAAHATERALARLRAEVEALTQLLGPADGAPSDAMPILAQLTVPPGLEAAVAALFDGELAAPPLPEPAAAACGNKTGWRELAVLAAPPPPAGARCFPGDRDAPPALARRLAHAALIDDGADGWRLQPLLAVGQSLVDRAGRLWRWDGFVRAAAASTATAERLRQRNRLTALNGELAAASPAAAAAGEAAAAARREREAAAAAERAAVAALRAAEERLAGVRHAEAELTRRGQAAEARLASVAEAIDKLRVDLAELDHEAGEAGRALALLPDPSLARSALDAARAAAAAARRRDGEARAALERLAREAAARSQRIAAIGIEEIAWQKRHDGAAAQQSVLIERRTALAAEIAELAARPAAIAAERDTLAQTAATAAVRLREADDALAGGEAALRRANEAARLAAAAVAEARERRAGMEARCAAATDGLTRLRGEIAERLGDTPDGLAWLLAEDGERRADDDNAADELAARLDRMVHERDAMGAVNLLAEQEAVQVETQLAGLERERTDLTQAIQRLRRGIATLDQEARARLGAAFDRLNAHFGELFSRLFGGGRAELAWTEGDDPLTAGLDVLASPPGKRLGALSLLSGGEQALTALALMFAVFLTNPAPICVLDEVDAPLDDANVDAFCRLVADIADATGTRFLVVTHHRVTMARMDRLFGVTMAERGVSQLVSVDLARAVELRRSA